MKLFILLIVAAAVLISGCVAEEQSTTPSPSTSSPTPVSIPAPSGLTESDLFPSISTSISPSNPSLGTLFTLSVTAEDGNGLTSLSWESSTYFSERNSDSFDCNGQTECSNEWEFLTSEEGLHKGTIRIIDTLGNSMTSDWEVNVGPYKEASPTPPEPAPSTTPTPPIESVDVKEDECNSNSDCGYKEICSSGKCMDVECTNNAHCSGCRRCSGNSCVSCGSGPYGCYC